MCHAFLVAVVGLSISFAARAQAAVDGPFYPAPAGNTLSGSGNSGQTGGRTNTYGGFNPVVLSYGLYWGKDLSNVGLSMDNATYTGLENMAFSGIAGNVATWTGTTNYITFGVTTPIASRFVLTTTNLDTSALNLQLPTAVDPTFPIAANAVAQVPAAGFNANSRFEVFSGGSWVPALTFFNGLTGRDVGTSYNSSFGGGFYGIPEPTSLAVVGVAGGLVLRRRRTA